MPMYGSPGHEGQKQQELIVPCFSTYIYRPKFDVM